MNIPCTEARIAASRIDGALSRGPVAEEGTAISARNDPPGRTILLPAESTGDFEILYLSHIAEYQPLHISEFMLVESRVVSGWREMRIRAMHNSKQLDRIGSQPVASSDAVRLAMASRACVAAQTRHVPESARGALPPRVQVLPPRADRSKKKARHEDL